MAGAARAAAPGHVRALKTWVDGSSFVVAEVPGELRAALAELGFSGGEAGFRRSFRVGPAEVARTHLRFAEHLEELVLQTARLRPAPWGDALELLLERLDGVRVDWWLTGSAALAVRGVDVAPRDLDLVTDDEGARLLAEGSCGRARRAAPTGGLVLPVVGARVSRRAGRVGGRRGARRRRAGADGLRARRGEVAGGRRVARAHPARPAARAPARSQRAARARRPSPADPRVVDGSSRSRHEEAATARLASAHPPRAAPSSALRRVRPARRGDLHAVRPGVPPAARAALRALRRADSVAGLSLCGVRRPPDRVHGCAGGGRLRGRRACVRRGVEGARSAKARSGRRRGGRRDAHATACGRPYVRPARRRPEPPPRPPSGRAPSA